ncbi:MAG: pyruvate ferredoxin oxidoreductase [Chromatiales bacterium]|nr:pyruvate ferredoxin oxidoreductase [Chromatiales bacterium]
MNVIDSGNVAAATAVKLAKADVIAAYPITPQTPLTEKLSQMIDEGEMDAEYVAVESEHSALAVCIGAASAGVRAFTATSANGLLYMSEQVHWAAGARLPLVMCVVNRGVGAPWTVWNDHQDSISQRDAGWIQIYVKDHQEIMDTTIKAFRLAEEVSIPVMVCYDGYYLSHTYMPYDVPEQEKVDQFLPPYHYKHTLTPEAPENLNSVTMPDTRKDIRGDAAPCYMDIRYNLHDEMIQSIEKFEAIDSAFQEIFERGGNPVVTPYRMDDAEHVVVAMGTLANQFKVVIDRIREESGIKVGVLAINLYRPFPIDYIIKALEGRKGVVVYEKALSYGNQGALFGDVKSALYPCEKRPVIQNHIIGLGGREIKTDTLYETLIASCRKADENSGITDTPNWVGLQTVEPTAAER